MVIDPFTKEVVKDWDLRELHVRLVKVAGISRHAADLQRDEFQVGKPLKLVREPDNQYDRNAIALYDEDGRMQIGYIPAEDASELARVIDGGTGLSGLIVLAWYNPQTSQREGLKLIVGHGLGLALSEPKPEEALEILESAIPEQLLRAASWAAELGQPVQAETYLRQAVENAQLGEERAYPRDRLSDFYRDTDRPQEAIAALLHETEWAHLPPRSFKTLEACALEAEDVNAYSWLATRPAENWTAGPEAIRGGVIRSLKAKNDSFAVRLGGLFSDPAWRDHPLVLEIGARIWESRGENARAISAYLSAVSAGSQEPFVYRRLTMLLDRSKRHDEAAHWCREALKLRTLKPSDTTDLARRLARLTSTAEERKRPQDGETAAVTVVAT